MNQNFTASSSQLGTVAEHLAAIQLMMASNGRLSPYTPMVDGDGYDVMVLDRETGEATPIQIKSWSKPVTEEGRATIQFDLRKAAYRPAGYVLAIHFDPDTTTVLRGWLIPMTELPEIAGDYPGKYALRPSVRDDSRDAYVPYRCHSLAQVAERLVRGGSTSLTFDDPDSE